MQSDRHAAPARRLPIAPLLVTALAAYQAGLGAYFIFWRPPLLPEDLRFVGAGADRLPRLEQWLDLVFTVLGGQMGAVGVMLAIFAVRISRGPASRLDFALFAATGLMSVGLMCAVNFALRSDFRWLLLAPVVLWLAAVYAAWARTDRGT